MVSEAQVKPLEWKAGNRHGSYTAHGLGILYAIDTDHECAILAKWEGSGVLKSAHENADAAKAFAQTSEETRIRSALVPAPVSAYQAATITALREKVAEVERERDEARAAAIDAEQRYADLIEETKKDWVRHCEINGQWLARAEAAEARATAAEAQVAQIERETIERCARLIEANMLCDDYRTSTEVLLPRTNPGNKVGFAYAAALRALTQEPQDAE